MSKMSDLQGRLAAVNDRMKEMFDAAGDDLDMTAEQVDQVRTLKAEQDDLGKQIDAARELEAMRDDTAAMSNVEHKGRRLVGEAQKHSADPEDGPAKTFGELFVQSDAFKRFEGGQGPTSNLGEIQGGKMLATLMTTTAGWAPESVRTGRVVESAQRPIQVIDLIPSGVTGQAAVVYMEETTFTNNAAETAEAGTYAESALALTQRTNTVRKIATFLPVTDEQLEDVDGIQSYVNQRLSFMLRQRLDSQLLVGNGTPPNLTGILNVAGIQTQAKGADDTPTAVYKAMTLVRVTGRAIPSGIIFNPTDWTDVKTLKTPDGVFIWGNPADAAPDRIWGVPVALSDALTQNTAIVGDFQTHSQLYMRRDVEVQISNSHSTYFIEGKQAIRADMRVAFVVYRPAAFVQVTGV